MQLREAIAAAGMTPPLELRAGRWNRFPGAGKKRGNTAGWCRIISPTLAIFGDWSTGYSETWTDEAHRDDECSRKLLTEARARERQFRADELRRQRLVEIEAQRFLSEAKQDVHPYLAAKGFKHTLGLVRHGKLLIPVRAVEDYRLITLQMIDADGTKKFLPGGRASGGIYRFGAPPAERIALCEGFATGLSVDKALRQFCGSHLVIVCFSASNLVAVADHFPTAIVCADHDASGTGEKAARETGLRWVMPPTEDHDFNDMHRLPGGLMNVVDVLRSIYA